MLSRLWELSTSMEGPGVLDLNAEQHTVAETSSLPDFSSSSLPYWKSRRFIKQPRIAGAGVHCPRGIPLNEVHQLY